MVELVLCTSMSIVAGVDFGTFSDADIHMAPAGASAVKILSRGVLFFYEHRSRHNWELSTDERSKHR